MKGLIVAAVSVLLLSGAGNYNAALGFGDKTCKVWAAERRGAGAEGAAQWFMGYISGLNIHSADMIIMEEEARGLLPQLDSHCAANPTLKVMPVATGLIMDDYQNRINILKRSIR